MKGFDDSEIETTTFQHRTSTSELKDLRSESLDRKDNGQEVESKEGGKEGEVSGTLSNPATRERKLELSGTITFLHRKKQGCIRQ